MCFGDEDSRISPRTQAQLPGRMVGSGGVSLDPTLGIYGDLDEKVRNDAWLMISP